jgi:hypothetical protein
VSSSWGGFHFNFGAGTLQNQIRYLRVEISWRGFHFNFGAGTLQNQIRYLRMETSWRGFHFHFGVGHLKNRLRYMYFRMKTNERCSHFYLPKFKKPACVAFRFHFGFGHLTESDSLFLKCRTVRRNFVRTVAGILFFKVSHCSQIGTAR